MIEALQWLGRSPAAWRIGAVTLCGLALLGGPILDRAALAEQAAPRERAARAPGPRPDLRAISEKMNANTLTLVTGNPTFIFTSYGNE
jgi:hypothetical protein